MTRTLSFSPISIATGTFAVLAVVYLMLIALSMGYAVLTVEFSQSVRSDESAIATLESTYLSKIVEISSTDYAAAGYTKPVTEAFVRAASVTALR